MIVVVVPTETEPTSLTTNVENISAGIPFVAARGFTRYVCEVPPLIVISANVSRADRFFTIDNRHLFLGFSYNNTSVLVADGMNNKGAIEKISFNDMTFNGSPA